jgi:hypothetical protein
MQRFNQTSVALSALLVFTAGAAHAATSASPTVPVMPTAPPAASELKAAVSSSVAATLATPAGGVLSGNNYGMTCTNNATVQADGNTVDTDGIIAVVAAAAAAPYGTEIDLPAGLCVFNKTITIPVTASLRFKGAGMGVTTLQFWTPNGVSTPVGSGLIFNITNNSSLTLDDFTINRRLGSNLGTTYVGTAISIAASATNPQAGNVTTTNLAIYPALANGQTDSWNIGLQETNIPGPVISNVTITLPGWGNIPNPSAYQCSTGSSTVPCAIHALPSPANPVATPANLAYGKVATGVALGGSGPGNYQIDSVISALTVSGGLVGLDLTQFQGAYVTDSKFASTVYGIRADTVGTTSELLSVQNSLFMTTVAGVYTNGVGGMQLTGNYIQHTDTQMSNLPSWSAVWANNDNNDTVTGNNIIGGGGGAVVPEYGIWHSSGGPNAFPVTISGNTLYSLSSTGSVCMGNTQTMQTINATGNSLYGCATYLADQNGNNAYSNNTLLTPSQVGSTTNGNSFANSVTIGALGNSGTLSVGNNGVSMFNVANGNVSANGTITAGSNISAGGGVSARSLTSTSTITMQPSTSHYGSQQVVGNFYFPNGTNPSTIALSSPNGGFPSLTAGLATMFGELTCSGNNTIISWHFVGHYTINGTRLVPGAFSATPEADSDSQAAVKVLVGTSTITPIPNPYTIGLEVSFGPGVIQTQNCTAMLSYMVLN